MVWPLRIVVGGEDDVGRWGQTGCRRKGSRRREAGSERGRVSSERGKTKATTQTRLVFVSGSGGGIRTKTVWRGRSDEVAQREEWTGLRVSRIRIMKWDKMQ